MKKKITLLSILTTFIIGLFASSANANPVRHCYIGADGQRHCYISGGGGHQPPVRPPRPPRPQPPRPPHNPPYYPPPHHNPPPHYPPYNPPPHYPPPVYNPPPVRPGWDNYRAERSAWDLVTQTRELFRLAEQEARYYNDSQMNWAVHSISELERVSQELVDQLRRYPSSPSYTSYNFRRVKTEFEEARESVYYAYFSATVDSRVQLIERIVMDLDQLYWNY